MLTFTSGIVDLQNQQSNQGVCKKQGLLTLVTMNAPCELTRCLLVKTLKFGRTLAFQKVRRSTHLLMQIQKQNMQIRFSPGR